MNAIELEALIGLFTGIVVGLTGASGVLLVVPLLTLLLQFNMHTAVGTSLFVDMITPLFVAISYYRRGNVNMKAGLWLAIGSILGAQGGALLANTAFSSEFMSKSFVFFMFIMAISMWIKSTRPPREVVNARLTEMNKKNRLITFGIGLVLGMICGLFGAGGGLMFLLVLLVVLKYPTHMAIGTSSLIMALTSASGTLGYALHGNVDFSTGAILAGAAVISGLLSARFANKIPENKLNVVVGSVFACLGIVMIVLK